MSLFELITRRVIQVSIPMLLLGILLHPFYDDTDRLILSLLSLGILLLSLSYAINSIIKIRNHYKENSSKDHSYSVPDENPNPISTIPAPVDYTSITSMPGDWIELPPNKVSTDTYHAVEVEKKSKKSTIRIIRE